MQKFKYIPKVNSGRFRHRITFFAPPGTIVDGWPSMVWTEHVTVWADIRTQRGNRLFESATVQMQDMKSFTIRYRPDVNDMMRIRHKGTTYNIDSMTNDDEKNEYYTILVKEVV